MPESKQIEILQNRIANAFDNIEVEFIDDHEYSIHDDKGWVSYVWLSQPQSGNILLSFYEQLKDPDTGDNMDPDDELLLDKNSDIEEMLFDTSVFLASHGIIEVEDIKDDELKSNTKAKLHTMRGHLAGRKVGITESKFLNYDQFITENDELETGLNAIISQLARNYQMKRSFYTEDVVFDLVEEERHWPENMRDLISVGKTHEQNAKYYIQYMTDNAPHQVTIKFTMWLTGQRERDVPEPGAHPEQEAKPAVKLDNIKVEYVEVDTPDYVGKVEDMSENTRRNLMYMLTRVLREEYDVLGEKIYSIAMQQN